MSALDDLKALGDRLHLLGRDAKFLVTDAVGLVGDALRVFRGLAVSALAFLKAVVAKVRALL